MKIYKNPSYKVSVIMPVFNAENFLERSINSVLKQTFTGWELMIVDDGSTDDSLSLLQYFNSKHSNVRVITRTNGGPPIARNSGIKFSKGFYISFLDSDDEYRKDHLQLHIDYMRENPEVDLIHGGVKIVGNEYVADKDNPELLIHIANCTVGGTFFGKRNVFIDINGFNKIDYSGESEFLERAKKKFKVKRINNPSYIYHRDNILSITNRYAANQ